MNFSPCINGFLLPSGDYAVVQVTKVKANAKANSQARQVFSEELENGYGLLDYQLYVKGMMNKADVEKMNS